MPGVRSVALGFLVLVGSRDEDPAVSGSSHFLEHLLFKGTKTRSARDIAEAFDAVGGDLNAFTAREYTCFYARVLDRDLPMAVEHLCDMFGNPSLRTADVEGEREVILEEIRVHEDSPDDLVHDLFAETLWPGHPLGQPILGKAESVRAATRERIRRFYRKHYVPAKLVVVAAGNVRHEHLLDLLGSRIGTGAVRAGRGPADRDRARLGDAPAPSGRTFVKRRKTEETHICIGTNGLSRRDPDRFAFGIVNDVLGGGMSSRLFQEIREKRSLAYSVYSYHSMFAEAGMFCAYAGTAPAHAKEVLDLVRRQLDDVAEHGVTEAELERAKGHMKGSLVLSLEEPSGRMSRLGRSEISDGEVLTVDQVLRRIDAVTLDDARRAAERVLRQPVALTVLGPTGKEVLS
jgi:predicted Zn-dependent peptidase